MKKKLLLVAAICMSASGYAQWTKPEFKNSGFTLKEVVDENGEPETVSDTLYLYNKEAGGFLLGANDWNTRASVGNKGYKVIIKKSTTDGCYLICDSVETQQAVKAMFADNEESIWVDNLNGANVTEWKIEENGDGTYKITNAGKSNATGAPSLAGYELGVAEKYKGETGNTRLWLYNPELTYERDSEDGELENAPVFEGAFQSKWIFVSKEDYDEGIVKVAQYLAAMSLKNALDKAKAEWDGKVDFSSIEAVYNNTSSTAEELEAAEAKINVLIAEYKSTLATFDEPTDFGDIIGDGSDIAPWTRKFTGNGEVGTWHTNTWSTEANNGADGTDMTTPFCEDWVASGGKLSDQKIFQTLKAASPGLYKFTLNIRAYSEAGKLDQFEGLSMYFGDQKVDLQSQTAITYSGSKSVLWSKNYFTIIAIVKEAGDIEFGLDIKDANFNWVAFKGTSLKYYGNQDVEANAAKLYKEPYSYDKAEEDLAAKPELIEAYNQAVDNFNNAESTDDVIAAVKAADEAKATLDANVAAYKTLLDKIDYWTEYATTGDYSGKLFGEFGDFVQSEEEIEGWPAPTAYDIKENKKYVFTTEEIDTYITTVDALLQQAIAESLKEGDDCSDMIANAKWKEADGAGWKEVSGKCTNKNLRGGLDAFPVAESWHSYFDYQQVVDNVPDGLYSISLNGFCRLDNAAETEVPAEIYMNDLATPLMNIADDAINPDEAVDGVNSYYQTSGSWKDNPLFAENSTDNPAGNTLMDQTTINANGWYTPNGMTGASIAFSADRYKATVYGLVQGGKMTIGVRNYKSTNVWALWSNFTLTYEGKNVTACSKVLEANIKVMEDYQAANVDNMSAKATEEMEAVIEKANKAKTTGNADDMMEAIVDCSKEFANVKELVTAYSNYLTAADEMETAYSEYEATASAEAKTDYEKYASTDAGELGLDDLKTLIENIKTTTAKLKVPDYSGASDDNGIDMSKVIVNATFDTVGDFTGWSGTGFGAGGTTAACAERYNMTYDTYQDLAGLPEGTYKLTVQGFYRQGAATDDYKNFKENTPAYNAYLYAVGEGDTCKAPIMCISEGAIEGSSAYGGATAPVDKDGTLGLVVPNTMEAANYWFEAGQYAPNEKFNSVIVKVGADGKLRIGVKKDVTISTDWSIFDNFTLTYYGKDSKQVVSEIEGTETAGDAAPVSITTLSGINVKSLVKGYNIITKANGEKVKVYVK